MSRAGRLQKDRSRGAADPALEWQMDVDRARIGEAAHTAKGAEMMVERAVLLHQNNDMLHILNRACGVVRGNRERLGDVRLQRAHGGRSPHQLKEHTPIDLAHWCLSLLEMV